MMPERNSTASRSSYRKEDDNYQHANSWVNNNLSSHWEPEFKQNDDNHFIFLQDIDLDRNQCSFPEMENDLENADQGTMIAGSTNGPPNFGVNEIPYSCPSSTAGFKSISISHGLDSVATSKTSQDCRNFALQDHMYHLQLDQHSSKFEEIIHDPLSDSFFDTESSFHLLNTPDEIMVKTVEDFIMKLGCELDMKMKVVSVFGHDGNALVEAINQTFYGGAVIFRPSSMGGIWAAYCQSLKAIILMVEGIQTVKNNPNAWVLLKIMALSDVVIYHQNSDIIHTVNVQMLVELSLTFMENYGPFLEAMCTQLKVGKNNLRTLGPDLVILHETQHAVSQNHSEKYADMIEQKMRTKVKESFIFYSSFHYLHKKTNEVSFERVHSQILKILSNNKFRCPRKPVFVYRALQRLMSRYGNLEPSNSFYLEEFFTCRIHCEICRASCDEVSNHLKSGIPHSSGTSCRSNNKHQNSIMYCRSCYERNNEKNRVVPKMPPSDFGLIVSLTKLKWSGYILNCKMCGVIYTSNKYWYGNESVETAAVTDYYHVWSDGEKEFQDDDYTGRRLIEQVTQIGGVLASVGAAPIEAVSNWAADKVAPTYWEPNTKPNCSRCGKMFGNLKTRHHCRWCGKCVCHSCSTNKKPVPEKGWGEEPVRVCDDCFANPSEADHYKPEISTSHLLPRKVGEYFTNTLEVLSTAIKYPMEVIKESARPSYWVKDELIENCCICKRKFNTPVPKMVRDSNGEMRFSDKMDEESRDILSIHHCRGCGEGVCDGCSRRRTVMSRNWTYPVRVCWTWFATILSWCGKNVVIHLELMHQELLTVQIELFLLQPDLCPRKDTHHLFILVDELVYL